MQKELKDIRKLLLFIVIPLVLYLLHLLSAIFVPLTFGFFGALLFMPFIRFLERKKISKYVGLFLTILIMCLLGFGIYEVFLMCGNELSNVNDQFLTKMHLRFNEIIKPVIKLTGVQMDQIGNQLLNRLKDEKVIESIFGNVGNGIGIVSQFITTILLSFFFMLLFLIGPVTVHSLIKMVIGKESETTSQKTNREVERVVFKFILVKTFISLLTGLGFTIICYFFGVSFPILWGVVAFFLNFIQFIGPAFSVIVLAIFSIVELNLPGAWLFFILLLVIIHILTGGILEPVLMGKSFSINTITIIVMFGIWGIVWGVSGMILSIPITALLKKILERGKLSNNIAKSM